jgi:hypothetical protein
MRARICLILLPGLLLGCASRQDWREKEPWTAEMQQRALKLDAERAQSETQRQASGWQVTDKLFAGVTDQIQRVWYWISGNSPFDAAKALLDPRYPDKRRQGIMYLSKRTWGREPPYTDYYAEMVRSDTEPLVRAIALRALNRARATDRTALYIKALDDRHELVRLEAAKALANMPAPEALESLIKRIRDEEEQIDVRIACADALRHYKRSDAAQALIAMLRQREFGLAWQARWTLRLMTGKDFGYEPAAWLRYLTDTDKPFG